jgi:hypothetical protein
LNQNKQNRQTVGLRSTTSEAIPNRDPTTR